MRPIRAINACLVAAVLVSVAASPVTLKQDPKNLKGAVRVDGSSTVYLIAEAVAEEFSKVAPGVNVTVGMSGTGEASSALATVRPIYQTPRAASSSQRSMPARVTRSSSLNFLWRLMGSPL